MQLKQIVCVFAVSATGQSVCSMLLFLLLILRRHQYLRLYLCRVILCGAVVDENMKRFEKRGPSYRLSAVLTFAWRA